MSRSNQLRGSDVRSFLRLMGELGELPNNPVVRAPFLMSQICRLINAQWGIIGLMRDFRPGAESSMHHAFQGGELDEKLQAAFFEYINVQVAVDPMVEAMQSLPLGPIVRSRPQVVSDQDWYRSVHVAEFRCRAHLDESLYAFYPFDRNGNAVGMGFTRPAGASRFTARERTLIELLNDGLGWFHHQLREDATKKAQPELSPALRRTLQWLLKGRSEKQIAASCRISQHTIHDHVKEIYRRWEVSSRAELLSKVLTGYGH